MARTIYALTDLAGNIIKAIANNPAIPGLVLLYLILVTQTEAAASGWAGRGCVTFHRPLP